MAKTRTASGPAQAELANQPGPLGRLGTWVIDHGRIVTLAWVLIVVGLGVFAPSVEKNLSGAGWQANGSESVAVRELAQEHFGGNASHAIQVVVHSADSPLTEGDGPKVIEINLNGHVWTAIIESHNRARKFPGPRVTVTGRSQTALLDSAKRSTVSDTDMQAQTLAEAELDLTGFSLDWDTLTWLVPAGAWAYQGLTPIAAVRKAAEASGAVVQSHPWDMRLRVVPRYPVSPWAWGVTAPDKQILDDIILEDSLTVVSQPVYNYVLVSGDQVGVSDPIIRTGSAGDIRADLVSDPLITTHDVAAERGRNVLSDRGEQARIDLSIPLYPISESSMPGLVLPAQLVEIVEAVSWKGLAVGTSIDVSMQSSGGASALVIKQRITLERHYTDAG